jgi:ABC-type antimicrobial peptide transport system permease subunit
VAIVSEAMARRFWGGASSGHAVGRRFRLGDATGPEVTVVGVAGAARFRNLTTDPAAPGSEPDVYFPITQRTDNVLEIVVRSRSGAVPSAEVIRSALAQVDASLPVYDVRPLVGVLRQQSATGRFGSIVLTAFSAAALLLAAVGIYGVVAFVVGLSRREIAIRMALGARAEGVRSLIVRNGLTLVATGVGLGLLGALALTRVLASQLVGVGATDPLTLGAVSLTVLVVALAASWLPARRAARVDPVVAMRAE